MRTGRMKRGFTLIETVVTVGIVAAMAAVVIPQVARQFDAADPTRIQNDFKNIQTAIETFNVNVKSLPGDMDDLSNPISGTGALDSLTSAATTLSAFSAADSALWKGPYIDIATQAGLGTDTSFPTGFGLTILESFVCYQSGDNRKGISEGSVTAVTGSTDDMACPNTGVPGQRFLAIQVTGITCNAAAGTTFSEINTIFDGTETTPLTTGRVRCQAGGSLNKTNDVAVLYFLAVPIS